MPVEFTGNDAAYLAWLDENDGAGYVVNVGRPRTGAAMLHGVGCLHLYSPNPDFVYTARTKLCSPDRADLETHVRGSHAIVVCPTCAGVPRPRTRRGVRSGSGRSG